MVVKLSTYKISKNDLIIEKKYDMTTNFNWSSKFYFVAVIFIMFAKTTS